MKTRGTCDSGHAEVILEAEGSMSPEADVFPCFWFLISAARLLVPSSCFLLPGFGSTVQVLASMFLVPVFCFQAFGSRFQVPGSGFQVNGSSEGLGLV